MPKLKNLSKEYIVVKVEDLLYANKMLLDDAISRLKESSPRTEEETLLTREQVMQKLNVVPSTLWRWQKRGYLIPIWVGGQHRYRLSDIQKILGGK